MIGTGSQFRQGQLVKGTEQLGEDRSWPKDTEAEYAVVLQIQTPSHAYRLTRMQADPEVRRRMLPGVEEVEEVDFRPTKEGLVLLRGLSTSCMEFKRWLDSSLLRFNITRAYFVEAGCCATDQEVRNAVLIQSLKSYIQFLHSLEYFRSVTGPYSNVGGSRSSRGDCTIDVLSKALGALVDGMFIVLFKALFQYWTIFCMHLRFLALLHIHLIIVFHFNFVMQTRLSPGWSLHPSSHTHTLFVVTISPTCYQFGLRPEEETFKTPFEAPTRVPGQLSKAAGKLAEALVASGFHPRTGVALDVGAAPGGWTAQLANRMNLVVAIDPAELHPDVQAFANVIHIRKKTQDAMVEIASALGTRQADILVCDANKHPLDVMNMLHPLFPILRPGALFILTLKFRGKGREKLGTENTMRSILGAGFGNVKLLHLFANTQWERMLVAVREEGPLGAGEWNGEPLFSGAAGLGSNLA